jgi:divalent metal cation (Fe/Co/Zn/Cd) transporter
MLHSAGAVGLTVIWVGKRVEPDLDLNWVDPAAAIAVALLIIRTAYRMVKKSARDILDASLPDHEVSQVKGLIFKQTPAVVGFHGRGPGRVDPVVDLISAIRT